MKGRASGWGKIILSALFLLWPLSAQAVDKHWNAGSGWWDEANKWNPSGQPQAGDKVYLTQTGNSNKKIKYRNSLNPDPVLSHLEIDATGQGKISLSQAQDSLSSNMEIIGYSGSGAFSQSGGTNSIISSSLPNISNTLILGHEPGSNGSYELKGGDLKVVSDEYIGYFGNGAFTQKGGTHTANVLNLGGESGSSGSYKLQGGNLSTQAEHVGMYGSGEFHQSGGAHQADIPLFIGAFPGSNGSYHLSGGSLFAGDESIGCSGGKGTFTQTGGTNEIRENLGLKGTYELRRGSLTCGSEELIQGGKFIQSGGINHSYHYLEINNYSGNGGSYTLKNGTVTIGYQWGGTVQITEDSLLDIQGGDLSAQTIQNEGTFNYSGGSYEANLVNYGTTNFSAKNAKIPGEVTNGNGTAETGQLTLSNNTTFNNQVTNNAGSTIKTTGATVHFLGGLINNGIYISDPSENYFSDLIIGETGCLIGAEGDLWAVSGDLINNSTQNTPWDTTDAYLAFTGNGLHNFSLTGCDYGMLYRGYEDNFAWKTLFLDSNSGLNLLDGNIAPGCALYVDNFLLRDGLDQIASISSNGFNIYYDPFSRGNSYLGGLAYNLEGGGTLCPMPPVPEPTSLLLLGSGVLGVLGFRRKSKNTAA